MKQKFPRVIFKEHPFRVVQVDEIPKQFPAKVNFLWLCLKLPSIFKIEEYKQPSLLGEDVWVPCDRLTKGFVFDALCRKVMDLRKVTNFKKGDLVLDFFIGTIRFRAVARHDSEVTELTDNPKTCTLVNYETSISRDAMGDLVWDEGSLLSYEWFLILCKSLVEQMDAE